MSKSKQGRRHRAKYNKDQNLYFKSFESGFQNYSKLSTESLNQRLIFHLMPYYNRYLDFTNDLSLIKDRLIPILEDLDLSCELEKAFKEWEAQNPRAVCEKILDLIHTYQ